MIYTSPYVYSFGRKTKATDSNFISKTSANLPGPGTYQTTQANNSKNKVTFSFGKDDKLKAIKSTTPGPGEYTGRNDAMFGKSTPHYSIGKNIRKLPFENAKDDPLGPGYYQTEGNWTKLKPKVTSVKMVPSRKPIEDKKTPGPGEYKPKEYFGKKARASKIGTSQAQRSSYFLKDSENNEALGPGYYQNANRSSFDKRNAKITIRGKPNDAKNLNTPGPGEYNSDVAILKMGKTTPKFSLGKEQKAIDNFLINKNEINHPGPGCYQTQSEFGSTNAKSIKAATFSKDPKLKEAKGNTIGPGYYKIPCSVVHIPDYVGGTFEPEFKFV